MRLTLGGLLAVGALLALPTMAQAQPDGAFYRGGAPAELDRDVPDEDWTWEDGHVLEDGTVEEGYYRTRARPGYAWMSAGYVNGVWLSGHWKWVGAARPGHAYERGHRGPDGFMVPGYWRPASRPGHVWVAPHRSRSGWVPGYWRPVDTRRDAVWVPGYFNYATGDYVPGHWRETARRGFVWVDGTWRYGRWQPGYWQPTAARAGWAWVGGYYGPRGWVEGFWRPAQRTGHHWRTGYWGPRGWVQGAWVRGSRDRVQRRYQPVRHVRHVAPHRVEHRRHWRGGQVQSRPGRPGARPDRPGPPPRRDVRPVPDRRPDRGPRPGDRGPRRDR